MLILGRGAEWRNDNMLKKTNILTAIRFTTLAAICDALECEAGDILEYQKD